ncbi:MAG TPA: TetR/AcrR family transcriptional regulator [Candidatus Aminicenantes bacterium]|nr:MAG: hypothetical protein C0168_03375 [Candidatus Aminicenantes bacterium]HEK85419.1 TetR/AcrR family transcriptional regulator [Candidatus Aminicenantes bacterium]
MKKNVPERKEIIQAEYRKLMLAAAEKVIIRRGYGAATMDEIAREAEFSKATIYKYFNNKAELLLAIILQYVEEIRAKMAEIQQSALQPDLKLKKIIESILKIQSEKENISRLFILDKSLHDFLHRFFIATRKEDNRQFQQILKLFKSKREEINRLGCLVIKEGIEQGKFVKCAPETIIKYVGATVEGLLHARYWESHQFLPEEETEEIFKFIMEGIGRQSLQKGEHK